MSGAIGAAAGLAGGDGVMRDAKVQRAAKIRDTVARGIKKQKIPQKAAKVFSRTSTKYYRKTLAKAALKTSGKFIFINASARGGKNACIYLGNRIKP